MCKGTTLFVSKPIGPQDWNHVCSDDCRLLYFRASGLSVCSGICISNSPPRFIGVLFFWFRACAFVSLRCSSQGNGEIEKCHQSEEPRQGIAIVSAARSRKKKEHASWSFVLMHMCTMTENVSPWFVQSLSFGHAAWIVKHYTQWHRRFAHEGGLLCNAMN